MLSAIDRVFVLLLKFISGDKVATLTTAPRAINPLLRTTTNPALPDAARGPTLIRTLRRTAAAQQGE